MSSVPEGRRSLSDFQTDHDLAKLRDEVTRFVENQFGFSYEKYRAKIEKYRQAHSKDENVEAITRRYIEKCDFFKDKFVPREYDRVLDIIADMDSAFTMGNSIFPSDTPARFFEWLMRRIYINIAISKAYVLKREINYVIRTLSVDINKYYGFAKKIDHLVSMMKGVRRADNRFLKAKGKKKTVDITNDLSHISECIIAIINKVKGNS